MAKFNTVRILIVLEAKYVWNILQFDVKNVFLQGELEEDLYMSVPPRYHLNIVCKLKKALYRFKQSLREWFGRFT